MQPRSTVLAVIVAAIPTLLILAAAAPVAAHAVVTVGSDTLAIGWSHEPTYVGSENAVQVIIKDGSGKPITDLTADDLKVVVSTGGQSSGALALTATYDEDTGLGIPGDYEASITPTVPGDYTFHVTGTVDGTAVDQTVTSGDQTFDTVVDPTTVQFPNKEPAIGDIVNRLDREDSRIAQASSDASSASTTGTIGLGVGLAGAILGLAGLATAWVALRRGRVRVAG